MAKDYIYVSPTIGILGLVADRHGLKGEAEEMFKGAFPLVCLEIEVNEDTGKVYIDKVLLQYRTMYDAKKVDSARNPVEASEQS